jgi:pSer/pThr/pTyr-binding forkhead associated (FHA) protein
VSGGAGSGKLTLQISGPYGDEKVDWKGTEILLGRNDAKTRVFPEVNLDDNAASRRHLSIWKDDADSLFYAQDLESANGTLLNGRDLVPGEPTQLNNGDILKIGTRYSIKVQIS